MKTSKKAQAKNQATVKSKAEAITTPTIFEFASDNPADKIFVAGEFNGWNPQTTELKYKNGVHRVSIDLKPGSYQYKFIVNGEWYIDPACPEWTSNEFGSLNSIKKVE